MALMNSLYLNKLFFCKERQLNSHSFLVCKFYVNSLRFFRLLLPNTESFSDGFIPTNQIVSYLQKENCYWLPSIDLLHSKHVKFNDVADQKQAQNLGGKLSPNFEVSNLMQRQFCSCSLQLHIFAISLLNSVTSQADHK